MRLYRNVIFISNTIQYHTIIVSITTQETTIKSNDLFVGVKTIRMIKSSSLHITKLLQEEKKPKSFIFFPINCQYFLSFHILHTIVYVMHVEKSFYYFFICFFPFHFKRLNIHVYLVYEVQLHMIYTSEGSVNKRNLFIYR